MMVFYLIRALIKKPREYYELTTTLNWVLGYTISINFGLNVFTAELSSSRYGRFLSSQPLSFQNIQLYILAPILTFLSLTGIMLISWRSHSYLQNVRIRKKDEMGFYVRSREDVISFFYTFLIALLILVIVFDLSLHVVLPDTIWLEFDPISLIYFAEIASNNFRLWLCIFAIAFFLYPLAFFLDFLHFKLPPRSTKLKKIDKKEREEGKPYLSLIRKYYYLCTAVLLLLFTAMAVSIPLEILSNVDISTFLLGEVGHANMITILLGFVITSSILFFLYFSYKGYKFWVDQVGTQKEFRSIYRKFQGFVSNRCLSFTFASSFLLLSLLGVRWLAEALFMTPIPAFDDVFAVYGASLFVFIPGVWMYGLATFHVYSYGKRPVFAAIFAFACSWVISELTAFFIPNFVRSLEISFLQAFVVFLVSYILSESLENYVKAKFREKRNR